MNVIFLDRVDAAPLSNDKFSFEFNSWTSNTIDVLNEVIIDVQDQLNGNGPFGTAITQKTQAQIIALAPNVNDGVVWYCTDHVPPCYVGKENGALVQFLTAPFP